MASSAPQGGSGSVPSSKNDEGLAQWGGGTPPKEKKAVSPRKRRRWPKIVLGVLLILVVGVGVLIAFAPAIASSMAPGFIEAAAKEEIKGSVKVRTLALSWGGPMTVGPVELYDDNGKLVGEVAATLAPGLWRIVSEQWWSKKDLDIGVVEVSGKLDVVQEGGESNLQRAIAPTKPSTPKPKTKGGMPFDSIKGTLKLAGLDVSYTDKSAPAGSAMASGVGVTKFGGDVKLDYDAKGGGAVAKADLAGGLKGAGAAGDKITLTADINLKQDAKGGLEKVDGKVDLLGAPLDLVDGLAGFGGALVKSIGARGDVRVQVNGNLDKATATFGALAEGASADMAFEYSGGVLKTTKPGVVKLRSTDFVAGMPGMKDKIKELGTKVRLDAGPSVDLTIASLALPVPRAKIEAAMGMGGAAPAGGKSDLDLRGGSVDVTLAVGAQRGQINTGAIGAAPAAGAAATPAFRPFAVEPLTLRLNAPTLEGAKRITMGTKATIDGKPAGEVAVDLAVTGLINAQGQFDMGALQKAEGEAKLLGVTTALLQPIVDAAGVAVDLAQDVGPTLDVVVKPNTSGTPAAGQLPATDLNLAITSANIKGGGDLRYDNDKVSTLGNGLLIEVASAGPLAARMMSKPGEPAMVSGKLPIRIALRDVLIDTKKMAPADMRATAEVRVSDGMVTLPPPAPEEGKPAPAPMAPIAINSAALTAVLAPGTPAAVGIDAAFAHDSKPFTVKGDFTAPGVMEQKAADANAPKKGPIESLLALKLGGRLDVQDVPRSLMNAAPALAEALNPSGTDSSAEIKRLVSRLIGESIDVALITDAAEGAQRAKLDIAGAQISATTTASVTPSEVNVSVFSAQTRLAPANLAPVLAAFTPKGEAKDGQPAAAVAPMTLADAVTVMVSAEPLKVPFKAGTTSPDLAAIQEAVVKLSTDKPILVSGIPAGEGKQEAAGLANLKATARLPGAYLGEAPGNAALTAKITTDVLRPVQGGAWAPGGVANAVECAKAEIEATLPKAVGAEQSFALKLTDVNAAVLSPLTGDPLLLPGTLGDKVQITANAKLSGTKETGQKIALQADIDAPRLRGASIRGGTQNDVFRVDAAKMTWTPSVAWLNSVVFAPKPGVPSDQLTEETTFTIDVKSLAAATSKEEGGKQVQGPMKPGVFNADVSVTAPRAVIKRPDGKTVQAENIGIALKGGQKPGSVSFDATIGRVSGEGAAGTKPSVLRGTVDNVADERGVLTTDNAVVNITGDLESFPTPLIDSFANQNGKVVDFLGSTLNLTLSAQNVSKTKDGGVIQAKASSPRAGAELRGVIRNQTFVQDGKFEVDVYELVKYEVAKKLPGGMPLVGFIEKKQGVDEPGTIKAEGLRVPMDNDMRKLNGVITVDPGTATFEFNDAFSKVLKQLSQKDRGQVGRRLDPFIVNIKDGVATYDKFRLKFGEFTLETTGAADLVQKRIDIVTYIPAGAVTEEVLGLFKGSLGKNAKGFTTDTKFPFTTKGPLDNPKTEPDFALFIKENAGKLIEDVGKGLLEDLLNKGKKDK